MQLKQHHLRRFEGFLQRIADDTYPEAISGLHSSITKKMFDRLLRASQLLPASRVLDVGCGQGPAMELFREAGHEPIGISLNDEDVRICQEKGYDVRKMDQSFLEFGDDEFDVVWCRHCLEHSVFPFFTLHEFNRVLKPGGLLYVEVPAPDTSCLHQSNKNHYSVLGKSMWLELMARAGFTSLEVLDIGFQVQAGPDTYWGFRLVKQQPSLPDSNHSS